MKSKILFSLFTLVIFVAGTLFGGYAGIAASNAPSVGQLWAGAKEMQAAIGLIDANEPNKARSLLCNSIKTRLVIMEMSEPLLNDGVKAQSKELEYVAVNVAKTPDEMRGICI
ncbi:hypothetical protein QWY77_07065 [Thalassotalea ponticola]|uniref:hypothetical protein n=1 Tax=Thalassotalea ponticola TaxID=1523392 RepID=UPI0025B3A060|nr:hypothetical protein [Thalassotalea ponticola]MDN3652524.1 hypothetical protein [Thalassotalea ponticola]